MKIEKNIPIPEPIKHLGWFKYPFKSMEIGDSFEITSNSELKRRIKHRLEAASSKYRLTYNKNIRFLVRETKIGVRIWRIE